MCTENFNFAERPPNTESAKDCSENVRPEEAEQVEVLGDNIDPSPLNEAGDETDCRDEDEANEEDEVDEEEEASEEDDEADEGEEAPAKKSSGFSWAWLVAVVMSFVCLVRFFPPMRDFFYGVAGHREIVRNAFDDDALGANILPAWRRIGRIKVRMRRVCGEYQGRIIGSGEEVIMENDKVYRKMDDLVRSINDKLDEVRVGVVRKSIERKEASPAAEGKHGLRNFGRKEK